MSESSTPPPALAVRGAVKRYGSVTALDGVDLTVDGGIFALVGANGAGKSTLFQAVLDLVPLDEGSIHVHGVGVREDPLGARRLIGYLPEEPRHYERLTGWEQLELLAGLRDLDNAEERLALLEAFDLADRRHVLIGEYSLGMRKKIGLVAALMGRPRLVILDEPLNGLDAESMQRLRLRIQAMAEDGTTFLLSSHVMAFVERVAERLAILRSGQLVAAGTPEDIRRHAGMADEPFEDVFLSLAKGI